MQDAATPGLAPFGAPVPGRQAGVERTFARSARLEVLLRYLDAECHKADAALFPGYHTSPTESDVLEAIGAPVGVVEATALMNSSTISRYASPSSRFCCRPR